MNDRIYLTIEEYKKIEDMVTKFPSISKKEAREYYLMPLQSFCNRLREELSGGVSTIIAELPSIAMNAAGNGDANFLNTKMYSLKSFVKEE